MKNCKCCQLITQIDWKNIKTLENVGGETKITFYDGSERTLHMSMDKFISRIVTLRASRMGNNRYMRNQLIKDLKIRRTTSK